MLWSITKSTVSFKTASKTSPLSPIFSLSKLSLSTDQTNQRSNFTAQPPWKEAKNLEISSSDKHYQVKKDLISSVKNEFRSQNEDTPPTPNLQREPTTRRTNRCRVVAKSVQVTAYNLFLSYLLGHFPKRYPYMFLCLKRSPWMLQVLVLNASWSCTRGHVGNFEVFWWTKFDIKLLWICDIFA